MYPSLRTIHLLCGAFALPALLMYGLSAVQMAHSKWFSMKPAVAERSVSLQAGCADARQVASRLMASHDIRGEINSIEQTPGGFNIRVAVPGTVHEIHYDRATGAVRIRTSVAGFMGMLNRLHHAAGVPRDYLPMSLWGVLVAMVSAATLGLGVTGIWMWWMRRQERRWGLVLIVANVVFTLAMLTTMRMAGP
jgi:hypothetical protein